jgi:hypothetical protein
VLANRLPSYLTTRVAALNLPPQVVNSLPKGGSANSILDPTLLAKLPPAFVHAIRLALSDTLHDIYFFAGAILVIALISTVFLKEVPLTGDRAENGFDDEPAVQDQEDEGRRERMQVSA